MVLEHTAESKPVKGAIKQGLIETVKVKPDWILFFLGKVQQSCGRGRAERPPDQTTMGFSSTDRKQNPKKDLHLTEWRKSYNVKPD